MVSLEKTAEMRRLKAKLSIELLWLYILKLLQERPLHGYGIRKEIGKSFGFLPGNVTSYVVLYKLRERGFVKAVREDNKSIYSITPKGKRLFNAGKKEWEKNSEKLFS